VAAGDWYSRRRQDVVGEFFRKVADQGPRRFDVDLTGEGRTPLGIAFRLMPDDSLGKSVPPQGIRLEQDYYEAEKN
jgi:hypothetical protein